MKKSTLFISGVVLGTVLLASPALAAENDRPGNIPTIDTDLPGIDTEAQEAARTKSEADITLIQEDVDPGNPNNSGPMKIKRLSHISFGKQKIQGNDKTYYANYLATDKKYDSEGVEVKEDMPAYIQIEDNRGTNAGWQLFVKNNGFNADDSVKTELKAAALTLKVTEAQGATASNNLAETKPDVLKEVTVNEKYQSLATATNGRGMGQVDLLMGQENATNEVENKDVKLYIPGASTKINGAKYTTTLTWLLMNDPTTVPAN